MDHSLDYFPLLVVAVLAVAVPVFLHRVRGLTMPIVVGEIMAGILVGRSGLDLIPEGNPTLEFLKIFGFTYLMFLSGMEVDFGILLRSGQRKESAGLRRLTATPIRTALVSFLVALSVSMLFAQWMASEGLVSSVWMMALVLSTTSLGVVVPVLKERGLGRTDLGQNILVLSVVADFATVFLVSAYLVLRTEGLTFEILFILVLLAVVFIVYRVARLTRRHLPLEKLVEELSHATGQLDTRGALALALVFMALAQGLGLEVILGAFLAGTVLSALSRDESSDLRLKLNALGYGFFIPIFFVMVGAEFDLAALAADPKAIILIPALLLAALAVKFAGALIYRMVFSWRETLAVGTLTSARLSLIIAVSAIGMSMGVIPAGVNSAIILLAMVTVIAAPLLFNHLVPEVHLQKGPLLIIGAPPHAQLLARRLRDHGERVRIITATPAYHEEARAMDLESVLVERRGDLTELRECGIEEARAVVCMLDDETETFRVASAARRIFAVDLVAAYVQDPQLADELRGMGVRVVDAGLSLAVMLEAMVRHPRIFSLLAEVEGDRHVVDIVLGNRRLEGRCLRDVPLPGDALILMVAREGETIIPRGNTRLQGGDTLTIVGAPEAVEEASLHLGG